MYAPPPAYDNAIQLEEVVPPYVISEKTQDAAALDTQYVSVSVPDGGQCAPPNEPPNKHNGNVGRVTFTPKRTAHTRTLYVPEQDMYERLVASLDARRRGSSKVKEGCNCTMCCCVPCSLISHLVFFVSIGLLVWQVPYKSACMEVRKLRGGNSTRWRYYDPDEPRYYMDTVCPAEYSEPALICGACFLCFAYFCIIFEAFFSDTLSYIRHTRTLVQAREQLNTLMSTAHLSVKFQGVCSHEAGSSKNRRTVVTLRPSEDVPLRNVCDVTGAPPSMDSARVTRVDLEAIWGFANHEDAVRYNYEKNLFIETYKHRDEDWSFLVETKLDGLKDRILVENDEGMLCCGMRPWLYWVLTLLGLNWPFRLALRVITDKVDIIIYKEANLFIDGE